MTPAVHTLHVDIGWGHCDPAGIVYFPRFFELFHAAMETWFGERLGFPYRVVIVERKLGFPAVHTEADFRRPTKFGDRVRVELRVARVGRTSLAFDYLIRGTDVDDDERVRGKTVCAVMDLDPDHATFQRAVELPADLRAAIEAFRAEPSSG